MILDTEHEAAIPIEYGKPGKRKSAGMLFVKAREDIKKLIKKGGGDSLDSSDKLSPHGAHVEKDGKELWHEHRIKRKEHHHSVTILKSFFFSALHLHLN